MARGGEISKKLNELRGRTPLSVQDVANEIAKRRGVKVPKSTYAHYESKKFKGKFIPADLAHDLLAVFSRFGIASHEILELAGLPGDKSEVLVAGPNAVMQRSQSDGSVAFLTGDQDLPKLGHVRGGEEGFFIDNGELAGFTMRPHVLKGVKDAYAVEVYDESMKPAFKHGHLVWVNPRKPVKPGDDVVVQLNDGQAFIKELVRRTDKELVLHQHNPPKDVKIPKDEVRSVHLIVGSIRVMT